MNRIYQRDVPEVIKEVIGDGHRYLFEAMPVKETGRVFHEPQSLIDLSLIRHGTTTMLCISSSSDSHSANTPFRFRVFAPAGSAPERLELTKV